MQNTSFNHSIKVPKLYKCAAKISQEVARGGGSIKQLVYEKKHFNTKALYALVVTTFQKAKEIDLLLKRTKLLEKESRLDPWLAKILISEVLWGKKQLPKSDAKPIQTILAYEQAFHAHLSDSSGESLSVKNDNHKKPRYVRINTLINPFNEALELFQDEGWTLQTPTDPYDYESFLVQVFNLEGDFMLKDMHIPDLLIFPGGTEFYNHPGYKKGALVLQDKASCLPVHILSPPPGSVVLDMCAAPGMKTTQLATMLNNEGTIYAVEKEPKRFEVLNKIVGSSGATCIKTLNKDVLQCGNSDFPDVEYILVDPTCSASGMVDRVEVQQKQDQQRLQKLAGFQIKILRSALTRYPKVKKVVYSTCSIYPEENEDVVRQVLETNNQFKLVPADKFINKAWKNFGSPDFGDIGKYCLYTRPEEDLTNGFFVAVFERLEEGEDNRFFNGRVLNYRKNVEQKQARKEKKLQQRLEKSEENRKMEGRIAADFLKIDDNTRIDGDMIEGVTNDDAAGLKQNKQHKRKHSNDEDQDIKKYAKKKKERKQDKNDNLKIPKENISEVINGDGTKELKDNDAGESSRKSKKKKRKHVNDVDLEQIDEVANSGMNENEKNINQSEADESVDKFIAKSKKKKRKHIESEHVDDNNINVLIKNSDNIEKELVDQSEESLEKVKKKKRKYITHKNLEHIKSTDQESNSNVADEVFGDVNEELADQKIRKKKRKHMEIEKSTSNNLMQDNDSTNTNLIDETIIDGTLKISKKKKRKNGEDEILQDNYNGNECANTRISEDSHQDVTDRIIDESSKKKKSKKKKDKLTKVEKVVERKEENEKQSRDDFLIESKKRKKKHSEVENTTYKKS